MTSAMMRLYALPTVEAAPLEPDQQPLSNPALNQADQQSSASADMRGVSPPETLPAESSVILSSSPPIPPETKLDTQPAPEEQDSTDGLTNPDSSDQRESSAPASLDSGSSSGSNPDPVADLDPKSDAEPNAGPTSDTEHPAAPQVPQKAETTPVRTIGGMRQVVEKRLAVIVEQDRVRREAKLRQMLVYTAMEYAWTGRFDEARQVAQHPIFSSDLQTELLAKIDMVQLEQQSSQLAGQSAPNQPTHSPNQQTHSLIAGLGAVSGGRNIPSGYSAGLSGGASYTAISLGQQCPIPSEKIPARKSVAPEQTVQLAKPLDSQGFPAFLPALSQNLAGRLVRLSQFPPDASQTAGRSVQSQLVQKSSVQASEQFVGVASRFQLASPPVPLLPALNVQPITLDSKLQAASQPQPIQSTQHPPIESFTSSKQFASNSHSIQPEPPFSVMMPVLWNLDQVLGIALDQSLERLSLSLPDWISMPLSSNWSAWTVPSSNQASLNRPSPSVAQAEGSLLALEPLEPLEQSLTAPQFSRDMQKLPNLSLAISQTKSEIPAKSAALAKSTAVATPVKPVLYDATALLAMNCSQAALTHYSGDQVMDPASSKRMGWANLMFPLPIAAVLTSAFGWRVHPISGALSFHTGLDLGAPMGTPVLAATAGRVVVADQMGGYGLAVVVEAGNQRNLYGHLSGIAVQPGVSVTQGAVLGWVGSTGNSTGPHLHFESQVATNSGWTAVDPIASATLAKISP